MSSVLSLDPRTIDDERCFVIQFHPGGSAISDSPEETTSSRKSLESLQSAALHASFDYYPRPRLVSADRQGQTSPLCNASISLSSDAEILNSIPIEAPPIFGL